MAKITDDTKEQVRAAADMVGNRLRPHGPEKSRRRSLHGAMPFHEERSPSFSVNNNDKLYHCFGCGVGGDIFDFVMSIENVDFPTALEQLADRYGVELKREDEDPRAAQRRQRWPE